MTFPSRENLVICFGHPAYQVKAAFDWLNSGVKVRGQELRGVGTRIARSAVVVVSGFSKNRHCSRKRRA